MKKLFFLLTFSISSIMNNVVAQGMSETTLPKSPAEITEYFLAEFKKGNVDNLLKIYELNSIFITEPGTVIPYNQIKEVLLGFVATGLPMTAKVRYVYENDGVALMIVDWSMEGVGLDGQEMKMEGSACDIVRKQEDGTWKYFIDNPFGTLKVPTVIE